MEEVCDGWRKQDQQLGFLRFLGFWLGDGNLDVNRGRVVIGQRKLEFARFPDRPAGRAVPSLVVPQRQCEGRGGHHLQLLHPLPAAVRVSARHGCGPCGVHADRPQAAAQVSALRLRRGGGEGGGRVVVRSAHGRLDVDGGGDAGRVQRWSSAAPVLYMPSGERRSSELQWSTLPQCGRHHPRTPGLHRPQRRRGVQSASANSEVNEAEGLAVVLRAPSVPAGGGAVGSRASNRRTIIGCISDHG